MKNWKKLLSLGLAVALSAGILTGCGSKEETADITLLGNQKTQ